MYLHESRRVASMSTAKPVCPVRGSSQRDEKAYPRG
jgi:hypothetical protein